MPKPPTPPNETARLESLHNCGILDTAPEAIFDDLSKLASRLCKAPIALISLVDQDRQWFKAKCGVDVSETHRDWAFCGYAILGREPFVVEDATKDARTLDNPLVTGPPGIRFYAGVPLVTSDGHALGTLCVIDTVPKKMGDNALQDLKSLARQASMLLELRKRESDLVASRTAADAANRSKTEFLANMSHEIRTPLTAILGYSEWLIEEEAQLPATSRKLESLRRIQRNGEHLLNVVDDILDLSKIEAGRVIVERLPTSLFEIVQEVTSLLESKARSKGVSLEVRYESTLPAKVSTDPTRLRQILLNLIGNAIKFTERGGVQLHVSHQADSGVVYFRVVDSGIGMSPEQLDVISRFDAFSQADASTTRKYGGTGLGLRISNAFAKMLGGEIQVASVQGEGSTFTLTMDTGDVSGEPLVSAAAAIKNSEGAATQAADVNVPSLTGLRLLLAEDGPDNQRLISFILRKAGAQVEVVGNGKLAVEAAMRAVERGDPFDVVLMDMQMPVLDGYDATRALRDTGYELPIVALTAHAMSSHCKMCLDAGCDAFATKPINRARLTAVIAEHAGRASDPAVL